jgi:hypothetical protein
LKIEEIGADDGQCMDFSIKTLGITHKQYSFIQGGDGGMECDEYVDVRKRYT